MKKYIAILGIIFVVFIVQNVKARTFITNKNEVKSYTQKNHELGETELTIVDRQIFEDGSYDDIEITAIIDLTDRVEPEYTIKGNHYQWRMKLIDWDRVYTEVTDFMTEIADE